MYHYSAYSHSTQMHRHYHMPKKIYLPIHNLMSNRMGSSTLTAVVLGFVHVAVIAAAIATDILLDVGDQWCSGRTGWS